MLTLQMHIYVCIYIRNSYMYLCYFRSKTKTSDNILRSFSSRMRLLIMTIVVLMGVSGAWCRAITSNAIVDQLYKQGKATEARQIIKLTETLRGLVNKAVKPVRRVCVWKICSKPVVKKHKGKPETEKELKVRLRDEIHKRIAAIKRF